MPTHIISTFEVYNPLMHETLALLGTLLGEDPSSFKLWTNSASAKEYRAFNISVIRPYANVYPMNGNLIVLGANIKVGHWYQYQNYANVSLIHLDLTQEMFCQTMHHLTSAGKHKVNIIYANNRIRRLIGLTGAVLSA